MRHSAGCRRRGGGCAVEAAAGLLLLRLDGEPACPRAAHGSDPRRRRGLLHAGAHRDGLGRMGRPAAGRTPRRTRPRHDGERGARPGLPARPKARARAWCSAAWRPGWRKSRAGAGRRSRSRIAACCARFTPRPPDGTCWDGRRPRFLRRPPISSISQPMDGPGCAASTYRRSDEGLFLGPAPARHRPSAPHPVSGEGDGRGRDRYRRRLGRHAGARRRPRRGEAGATSAGARCGPLFQEARGRTRPAHRRRLARQAAGGAARSVSRRPGRMRW